MVGIPIVSHVLPSRAIIRELVARGHRVTYANDPFVADLITAAGAELVPCTSRLPVADNIWPDDPIATMGLFLDDAIQALPQLRAAYDQDPADLYLYDIGAYAARALAESQGRPLMQLSPTFVAWDGYEQEVAAHVRKLPGADKQALDAEKAVALMLAQPSMIKRPVLDIGDRRLVGFSADIWSAAL